MKTVVVSGVCPGSANVGSIILRDLLSGLPGEEFLCVGVNVRQCGPVEGLDRVRSIRVQSSADTAWRPARGLIGTALGLMRTCTVHRRALYKLQTTVLSQARAFGADRLFMILDTPSTIGMGPAVARRLGVPLSSLIWDPPDYVLRTRGWDRLSRKILLSRFNATLRASSMLAVVSEEMREEYGADSRASTVILRHAAASRVADAESPSRNGAEDVVIGFAGSMYAEGPYRGLLSALDDLGWQVGGRPVTLRLLGTDFRVRLKTPGRVECLGWRDEQETREVLSRCDLAYLPVPFEGHLTDLARLSFPTKLSGYLAAGTPVFVHAPVYSSLKRFHGRYNVGPFCSSLGSGDIAASLVAFLTDPSACGAAREAVRRAVREEFNVETFQDKGRELLGADLQRTFAPPRRPGTN